MPETGQIRRCRRFAGWDYAKGASLFISISTEPRRPMFGEVRNGVVNLSPLGEAVRDALDAMPRLNPGLSLFGRVVMPDHVHFNCALAPGLAEPLKVLGNAIRRFKNYTTKQAKHNLAIRAPEGQSPAPRNHDGRAKLGLLWQQGYHDYLLLSRKMIDSTERYIAYNPPKWELMHGSPAALRINEPLSSPRLDTCDYWKGVGNTALLNGGEKLLSLRVSREVRGVEMERMLARIASAVSQGYTIISGFVSKGEQAVRDMLCARKDARFIRILPSCIPNARFKPESRYVAPFMEGRYLEIAEGNEEVEFGRRACLDINAEIIEIATAGEGLALYWKADGPHVLAKSAGLAKHSSAIKSGFAQSATRNDGRAALGLFITGGTGFFGKSMLDYRLRHPEWKWAQAEWTVLSRSPERFAASCPQLAKQPGVSFVTGDVRDFAFPQGRFDAIIHAATSAVTTLSDDEMTSVIVDGACHVAEFAKATGCRTVLFTSSGAVYGPRTSPACEDDACAPSNAYGNGKLAAEKLLISSGLDLKIARCFAFSGPHLNRTIHFAIGNFIQNCLDGKPIIINGDGTPLRSYLYADDLVEWLFAILERGETGRPYNVGSDRAISIRELAETVRRVLGGANEIVVKGSPSPNAKPSVYVPAVERAKLELGLRINTDLELAIKRTATICRMGLCEPMSPWSTDIAKGNYNA